MSNWWTGGMAKEWKLVLLIEKTAQKRLLYGYVQYCINLLKNVSVHDKTAKGENKDDTLTRFEQENGTTNRGPRSNKDFLRRQVISILDT